VSASGYRAWQRGGTATRVRLTEAQAQAQAQIKAVHIEFKTAYGSRRIHLELRQRGLRIGRARVERLMRNHGIRARHKRRFKVTTDSAHGQPITENLLARRFNPKAPNRVWTSDITFIATGEWSLTCSIGKSWADRSRLG